MSYLPIPIISGLPIPLSISGTGYLTIDFSLQPQLYTATLTGATLISGSNYVAGGAVAVRLNVSGVVSQAVYFPATWNNGWITSVPTGLATGRFAIMTINMFTASDSGATVAWAVAA